MFCNAFILTCLRPFNIACPSEAVVAIVNLVVVAHCLRQFASGKCLITVTGSCPNTDARA